MSTSMNRGKRHHRDDALNQDRDTKRRKLSRGPHDPFLSQTLGPHSFQGPPISGPMPVNGPPPHNYVQANPQAYAMNIYGNAPPYNSARYGPPPNMQGQPPRFDYPNGPGIMNRGGHPPQSHISMPQRQQSRMQVNAYSGPHQPSRAGYGILSQNGQPPVQGNNDYSYMSHQGVDHGRHPTTPMSPTGSGKRKPSIFHTPVHKATPIGHSETSLTPKSPGEPQKRVPLQARRDLQLQKISTSSESRKPTKEELLTSIESYDIEIAKLEQELSQSKQMKISDSVVIDEEKCLQDGEIKKKPLMHQLLFSNFVKSIEAHSRFDHVKYIPLDNGPEVPLQNEQIWKDIYAKCREDHKNIEDQATIMIKYNVDRDKRWIRSVKRNFFNAQKKWLKAKKIKIKPPPKEWLAVAAIPPPMLTEQQREFVFFNENLYVEDPVLEEADYYNKSAELSRWSEYEIEIFRQKYHLFPKNFRKISEYLPNKTVGDCICFYYHNKKDKILKQVMDEVKAKGSFQAQWSEGSTIGTGKPNQSQSEVTTNDANSKHASDDDMEDSGDEQYIFKPSSRGRPKRKKGKENPDEWTEMERAQFIEAFEAYPKDWKRISNTVQTRTVAQCKNFFTQFKDELGLGKSRGRRGRRSTRSTSKPEEPKKPGITAPTSKSRISGKRKNVNKRQANYWTKTEKIEFLQCLQRYGKDWKTIADSLESKTESQVMKYYQSIKKTLGLSTSDEDSEVRKEKKRELLAKKDEDSAQSVDSQLPPDNDLRFFAEIAAIKESIDLNSEGWIDDIREDKTYSNTTLLHSWIAKKYLSGVPPTDERPLALEVLARESVKKYKYSLSIPDDIKPFVTENSNQISNITELNKNGGLGDFWGDNLLDEPYNDDDLTPPIGVLQHHPNNVSPYTNTSIAENN